MKRILSIFICIMSCFLIVGCGSSSKMDGTYAYDSSIVVQASTNVTSASQKYCDEVTIKNGKMRFDESKTVYTLVKEYTENGVQFYSIKGLNDPFLKVVYYDDSNDSFVFRFNIDIAGHSFVSDSIYKRK